MKRHIDILQIYLNGSEDFVNDVKNWKIMIEYEYMIVMLLILKVENGYIGIYL